MCNPIGRLFVWIALKLADLQIIDAHRGKRTAELSWPRILTGVARMSQQTADAAMLGFVLGPQAIAGLGFASLYWELGNSLSLGLTSGTVNQTSQRFGAGRFTRVELAAKQSIWVACLIAAPFTVLYWFFPAQLIGLFGGSDRSIAYGATYLQVLALAMVPNFLNTVASRTLAGCNDTWIPMVARAGGAVVNITLNAVLIFGFGLGMLGAALGTLAAELFVLGCFAIGFYRGRAPVIGTFPVTIGLASPHFDRELSSDLLTVSIPLMIRKVLQEVARFPFFAILALFGPIAVASYEVSRRVMALANTPGWGFELSATSLVGQEIGQGNATEANEYGWDILHFSLVIYVGSSILLFVFARYIALLFVRGPGAVAQAIPFLRITAIALLARGLDRTITGILQATGDTSWPLYGKFVGLYLCMIPLAYLGAVTPIAIFGVYLAMIAEWAVPAAVNFYRFWTGKWIDVGDSHSSQQAE